MRTEAKTLAKNTKQQEKFKRDRERELADDENEYWGKEKTATEDTTLNRAMLEDSTHHTYIPQYIESSIALTTT